MKKLNLIVVFNKNLKKTLFCIREKEPYKGLYNFVGGKVEDGENNDDAAYRELFEETGISRSDIELDHFMDLNYFKYENNLQVYYGILQHDIELVEEKNKLEWVDINDGLLNNEKFAGNYNVAHIVKQIMVWIGDGKFGEENRERIKDQENILADKLDIKKTRISEEGLKIKGNRQYGHIEDIIIDIKNNELFINFITDGRIIIEEVNDYYFTHKVFKAIEAFSKKLDLEYYILMDNKEWEKE